MVKRNTVAGVLLRSMRIATEMVYVMNWWLYEIEEVAPTYGNNVLNENSTFRRKTLTTWSKYSSEASEYVKGAALASIKGSKSGGGGVFKV